MSSVEFQTSLRQLGIASFVSVSMVFLAPPCCAVFYGQSGTPASSVPPFLGQIIAKYPLAATANSITLSGTASWIAGSEKESGNATITAGSDGSATIQLNLNRVHSESQSAIGDSRTCTWLDAQGKTQQQLGPDCSSAVPWFAPIFFLRPLPTNATKTAITDAGEVIKSGLTVHKTAYTTTIQTPITSLATKLTSGTEVDVFYDPLSLLPKSIEYKVHSDKDLTKALPVRVEYDDYQLSSGIPIPHSIKKYVNNTLQLSLTISSVNLN